MLAYWRRQQKTLQEISEQLHLEKEKLQRVGQVIGKRRQQVYDQLQLVHQLRDELLGYEQNLLELRMGQLRSKRKRIDGDSACVFRSTSDQKYGTQSRYHEIRAAACEQLLRWKDLYIRLYRFSSEEEFLEYVEELSKPYTWADDVAIGAICDMLNVTFQVISSDLTDTVKYYDPILGRSPIVFKICCSHCHWDSLYLDDEYMPLSPERVRLMSSTGEFYSPEIKDRARHTWFD